MLVYGLDLRRDICREIRRFKPDVVLGTGYAIETPYGFDQADHRAAGLATRCHRARRAPVDDVRPFPTLTAAGQAEQFVAERIAGARTV